MTVKLIALDLDGTLLTDDKKVSSGNREAIHWATEKGVDVAFATGRSIGIIPPDAFSIPDIRYMITSNGAIVSDRLNGMISHEYIPAEAVDMLTELLCRREDMVEVFVNGTAHTQRIYNEEICEAVKRGQNPYYYYYHRVSEDDIFGFMKKNRNVIEMIIVNFQRGEDPRMKLMTKDQIEQIPGLCATTSLPYNIEIVSGTAGKGNALVKLAELLGIERDQVVSMGDSLNDMTMPDVSGICVAMGNGREEVKDQADIVTKSNMDDGVAAAIYEILGSGSQEESK
ncbi:MAG: Cof-type HAD-IIB family hydrolase [Bacillota bacterium]|nr:Cof-type HAD-IIB family hydrolase [Bacillota bacterium]